MTQVRLLTFAAMTALAAVGCGAAGLPPGSVTSLSSAKAAVRAADEVGAGQVPRAALHMKYAKDQISEAESLLEDGEESEAQLTLTRAEADAEVAMALAREAAAESSAGEAETRLSAVRRASQASQEEP